MSEISRMNALLCPSTHLGFVRSRWPLERLLGKLFRRRGLLKRRVKRTLCLDSSQHASQSHRAPEPEKLQRESQERLLASPAQEKHRARKQKAFGSTFGRNATAPLSRLQLAIGRTGWKSPSPETAPAACITTCIKPASTTIKCSIKVLCELSKCM